MRARRVLTVARIAWLEMLRRKEIYVLGVMLAALLLTLVSLDVFGLGQVTGYVKDIGLLACWVLGWVLAVQTSVRQLPQEESRGTVYALLAKPISRLELLVGKWLGAWVAATASTACFYGLVWGVVAWHGGAFDAVTLLQTLLLHGAALAVMAALAIALSTRLTLEAAATLGYVITGGAFVLLPQLPQTLAGWQGPQAAVALALYYLLPHFELFDLRQRLVHGWGAAPWAAVAEVLAYGAVYTALLLVLGWMSYRRRRLVRSEIL